MTVKAVEMVRKIRDKNYRETKDMSFAAQLRLIKKKAASLSRKSGKPETARP
jgi:hypothetical protein